MTGDIESINVQPRAKVERRPKDYQPRLLPLTYYAPPPSQAPLLREMELIPCFSQTNLYIWSKFHKNQMYLNFLGALLPFPAPLWWHLEN